MCRIYAVDDDADDDDAVDDDNDMMMMMMLIISLWAGEQLIHNPRNARK